LLTGILLWKLSFMPGKVTTWNPVHLAATFDVRAALSGCMSQTVAWILECNLNVILICLIFEKLIKNDIIEESICFDIISHMLSLAKESQIYLIFIDTVGILSW